MDEDDEVDEDGVSVGIALDEELEDADSGSDTAVSDGITIDEDEQNTPSHSWGLCHIHAVAEVAKGRLKDFIATTSHASPCPLTRSRGEGRLLA